MGCESLLAQIRQASPTAKAKPTAIRVLHSGLLTQLRRIHRDQGLATPSVRSTKSLVRMGAPIRANKGFVRRLTKAKGGRCYTSDRLAWCQYRYRTILCAPNNSLPLSRFGWGPGVRRITQRAATTPQPLFPNRHVGLPPFLFLFAGRGEQRRFLRARSRRSLIIVRSSHRILRGGRP